MKAAVFIDKPTTRRRTEIRTGKNISRSGSGAMRLYRYASNGTMRRQEREGLENYRE